MYIIVSTFSLLEFNSESDGKRLKEVCIIINISLILDVRAYMITFLNNTYIASYLLISHSVACILDILTQAPLSLG